MLPRSVKEVEQPRLPRLTPRHVWVLFAVACVYLVFPIIDIPLMGVSLSAPIFYLIILEITLRPTGLGFWPVRRWKLVLIAFVVGLLASYVVSTLVVSKAPISWRDGLLLIRYVYWVVVFVVSTIVVAHLSSPVDVVKLLGWSVIGLGMAWLWDWANLPGAKGALLTPNSYGFVFSTFWPFALSLPILTKRKVLAALGLAILGAAVVLNGSRGSWVATSAATFLFFILLTRYRAISVRAALFPLAASAILLVGIRVAPEALTSHASDKVSLSSDLGVDKSWEIRKLMVRKGWQLFQESPVFGVGAGRFTKTMAELELPRILRYGSQERFNRKSAHNSYVALLAETGIVGTLPFAVLLGGLAWKGHRSTRWLLRRREVWPAAVYCSFAGMSIHMWVIAALTGTHVWLVYGLVAGMIAWQVRMRWSGEVAHARSSTGGGYRWV